MPGNDDGSPWREAEPSKSRGAENSARHEWRHALRLLRPTRCYQIRLFRLDTRELDHLGPLLGFCHDQPAEFGRRTRTRDASQRRVPRPQRGIGKGRIDLGVELLNDRGWRALWGADTSHGAGFVTRYELAHSRQLGQCL